MQKRQNGVPPDKDRVVEKKTVAKVGAAEEIPEGNRHHREAQEGAETTCIIKYILSAGPYDLFNPIIIKYILSAGPYDLFNPILPL